MIELNDAAQAVMDEANKIRIKMGCETFDEALEKIQLKKSKK